MFILVVWLWRTGTRHRRRIGDILAAALALGLGNVGLGCYAVGEHLGRVTRTAWGAHFLGGDTIEPLRVGSTVYVPALYEAALLAVVAAIAIRSLLRSPLAPGVTLAGFLATYGASRFLLDFLRVNDQRVAGLTAAQYASAVVTVAAAALFVRLRTKEPALA